MLVKKVMDAAFNAVVIAWNVYRHEAGVIRAYYRRRAMQMQRRDIPAPLWNFVLQWAADTRGKTALPLFKLDDRAPWERLTGGNMPDISLYVQFDLWQCIWYHIKYQDVSSWPLKDSGWNIGRWLIPAYNAGMEQCSRILPISGVPIARSTVKAIMSL